jgi:hypothetical protein
MGDREENFVFFLRLGSTGPGREELAKGLPTKGALRENLIKAVIPLHPTLSRGPSIVHPFSLVENEQCRRVLNLKEL